MIRRTRVEVDLDAIVANARLVRQVSGTELYAVVKADAYGHGAVAVATALEEARAAAGFCTSLVEEGLELRQAGIALPILVMGPSQIGGEADMVASNLTPVISSAEQLAALAEVARDRAPVEAHLEVDTGMGRLGVPLASAPELAEAAGPLGIAIVGLMTHFACADSDDPAAAESMTRAQLERFFAVHRAVVKTGAPLRVRHAANSSAALGFPRARLDAVRVGIALYGNGLWSSRCAQAMRVITAIAQLRTVPQGTSVGYGATWLAPRDSRVAILPFGYADGIPQRASGHAEVQIRGIRVPLVGRISMDISVADVTDIADVAIGDEVVLLGRAERGGGAISAAEYGAWAGLSEYEVTCGISRRVPRSYLPLVDDSKGQR